MTQPIRMGDLAPWDQVSLCSVPRETFFANAPTGQELCKGDNQRMILVIAGPVGAAIIITTKSNPGTPTGLTIASAVGFILLNSDQWGPLVNQQWFLSSGGPVNITVFEVVANTYPDPSQFGGNGQRQGIIILPGAQVNVPPIQPNNGSGIGSRFDYRWPKSQTPSDNDIPANCRDVIRYIREARCE